MLAMTLSKLSLVFYHYHEPWLHFTVTGENGLFLINKSAGLFESKTERKQQAENTRDGKPSCKILF